MCAARSGAGSEREEGPAEFETAGDETGTICCMTDWATLETVCGDPEGVPGLIADLADPEQADLALSELCDDLVQQGTRCSAATAAVPLLVDAARDTKTVDRRGVLSLIRFTATGFLVDHIDWREQRDAQLDVDERAAWNAVAQAAPALRSLLDDPDRSAARAALSVLAWAGDANPFVLERMRRWMADPSDDHSLACAWLAAVILDAVPDGSTVPTRPEGGELGRFATSLAALRLGKAEPEASCFAELQRATEDFGLMRRLRACELLAGEEPEAWATDALSTRRPPSGSRHAGEHQG